MTIIASLIGKLLPPDLKSPDAAATTPPAAKATASPAPASSLPEAPRQTPTTAVSALQSQQQPQSLPPHDHSMFSSRSLKQLGLFFAGATFFALSTTLTRRTVARKQLAAQLKFYSPSGSGQTSLGNGAAAEAAAASATKEEAPHGSFMALEALNLATLNVMSFFLMLTGGMSWALDLSSMDDVRALARRYTRGQNLDGTMSGGGMTDEEAEREVEEWVAKILKKSDGTLIGSSKKGSGEDSKK
ncbi:hypothetical protein SPBR_06176 [Sporothrix brasiliensis 5110]|uniref:Altered inheritance of mitochondria protein 11 n=1 Tax=Sporothrix brasiliensis 5110 TaxID=1398154 RepID=A0A0C2FUJ2_9PEZI|nr:uncharacterized protein SPBR_06176 [Sporothrix brasiliensis 5110]KIH94648.1 hypothetical protein SPBR_06176 [Sporothrix brasiliensis 5110]